MQFLLFAVDGLVPFTSWGCRAHHGYGELMGLLFWPCTQVHGQGSPAIRAGKGWRGRRELAPRCSATQLGAFRNEPGQTRRCLQLFVPHTPHTPHTHHTHTTHTTHHTPPLLLPHTHTHHHHHHILFSLRERDKMLLRSILCVGGGGGEGGGAGTDSYLERPERRMFLAVFVGVSMEMVIFSGIALLPPLSILESNRSFSPL